MPTVCVCVWGGGGGACLGLQAGVEKHLGARGAGFVSELRSKRRRGGGGGGGGGGGNVKFGRSHALVLALVGPVPLLLAFAAVSRGGGGGCIRRATPLSHLFAGVTNAP
jgi:hypothetical protein